MCSIKPLRYDIILEPDLENFTFKALVKILLESSRPCDRLFLDCRGPAIQECRLAEGGGNQECAFELIESDQRLEIGLPRKVNGEFTVEISFRGDINRQMTGFYRSSFSLPDGGKSHLAVTQFQESYARQAFPCIDRPEAKAVFQLKIRIPSYLEAVSNTEIQTVEPASGNRKLISFRPTPPMSTYLLFWAVGPFRTVVDKIDPRVRALVLLGQMDAVGKGLEFGRQALGFCEEYFRIAYPLSKLDLIAVADFVYGAMENWGAITFRENLLLDSPGTTPRQARLLMAVIVAHEIVHQWFGNLVTPESWKYIWLNESFATYLAYKAVASRIPGYRAWDDFLAREMTAALERDGLEHTCAIEIPGRSRIAINAATAPIVYSKGGAMLRMVEGYIGKEGFRNAVEGYLNRHAYGCAASSDLWQAFEKASGLSVAGMIRRWIEQPGYPLLKVVVEDRRLELRQSRFCYLPAKGGDATWPLALGLDFFTGEKLVEHRRLLMETPGLEWELPEKCDTCLINPGRSSFVRVFYVSPEMRMHLAGLAGAGKLKPVDRWALEDDFFAAMRKGLISLDHYLELADKCQPEASPDLLVSGSLARHLTMIARICGGENGSRACAAGRRLAAGVLDAIGWQAGDNEELSRVMLRSQMLWHGSLLGLERAREFGRLNFKSWLDGKLLDPDIAGMVFKTGALLGGPDLVKIFLSKLEQAENEHQRLDLVGALGWFASRQALTAAMDAVLEKVPARLQHIAVAAAAENPAGGRFMLEWFEKSMARFEKLHPLLFERMLIALVPLCGLEGPEFARKLLAEVSKRRPECQESAWMALQWLEVNLNTVVMDKGN